MISKALDYASRKFLIAMVYTSAGVIALLSGRMDGPTFVALATLVLGVYGYANVAAKKATNGS
jgi:hypothetical protein